MVPQTDYNMILVTSQASTLLCSALHIGILVGQKGSSIYGPVSGILHITARAHVRYVHLKSDHNFHDLTCTCGN